MANSEASRLAVAIAVHPLEMYLSSPAATAMQEVLNDTAYSLTIGVTAPHHRGGGYQLYVQPDTIVSSPVTTGVDITNRVREKKYGHPYYILQPEDLTMLLDRMGVKNITITLMGGEVGGPEGCHHAAFDDLVNWFYQFSTQLESLSIKIPLNTLFTVTSTVFDTTNAVALAELQERYRHPKAQKYSANNEEINVEFSKRLEFEPQG